jgi:hypothetical protein
MVLFVVDPFVYHPLHYALRAATPGDIAAFAVLACWADLCMKAGFLREAAGATQQGPPFRPVGETPCL